MMDLSTFDLKTFDQLSKLIDIDNEDSNLKKITKLFLEAANDWPTPNQNIISEFVNELKSYFGSPLTKEEISKKFFFDNNAWQYESGSSILLMLKLSEKLFNESNFDKILQRILYHYGNTIH